MATWTLTTQDEQIGRITTALGTDAVLLEGFAATERLSEPFSVVCEVLAPGLVDFEPKLGTPAGVEVTGDAFISRAFHGILTEVSEVGRYNTAIRYSLVLRPWFWLLGLGRNSRIFQHLSAQDIIKKVFTDAGVSTSAYQFSLNDRGTTVREYCVQYDESDFNFVSRLMEEEGIYYYFVHTATSHVMKLCDGPACHAAFKPGSVAVNANAQGRGVGATLWHWTSHVRPALTQTTLRDVHFKTPDNLNEATSSESGNNTNITTEIFEYPGGFSYLTDDGTTQGADLALIRLQAGRAERTRYTGEGDVAAITVGCLVTTDPVDSDDDSITVMVTGTLHRLSGQTYDGAAAGHKSVVSMSLEGVPSSVTWRPERRARKPRAWGPHVATVVGPSGKEIDVDEMGRVRVQFPWDREGQSNEKSSCRLRVSSGWAGKNMGDSFFPRIGHEVLVDFLEGDMDRPVVTGRVYNADTTNILNNATQTWSGIKTQTVEGASNTDYDGAVEPPTTDPGYNAISFNDKAGSEYLYLRAQRDMGHAIYRDSKRRVHRDEDEWIGRNLKVEVKTGDETHTVTKGKRTTSIQADETLTVESGDETHTVSTGKRTTSIKKVDKLTVEEGNVETTIKQGDETRELTMGKRTTTIFGDEKLTTQIGDILIEASAASVKITALTQIVLKCGESEITMTPPEILIKSLKVTVQGDVETDVKAGGVVVVNGGMVQIN